MALLEGKVAIITGAASGIGAAAARRFAAEGANVALLDVAAAGLASLEQEIGAARSLVSVVDVADEEAVRSAVGATLERFGRLDVALLNVGVAGLMAPIAQTPLAAFEQTLRINVCGAFNGLRHILPEMARRGGGSIVLTASTAGFRAGAPGRYGYVVSKHAVVGLMRAAAAEGARSGVRVNSVSPGGVDTPMTNSLATIVGEQKAREALEAFERTIPLGRIAQPQEIADALLFFASDLSRYCTGTNLMVDGGLMG